MSDDYRELHTCLTFYRSTPWLISKTLNLFTNLNIFIYNIYTSLPNSSWNAVAPWSTLGAPAEHQTSDASIGYPPGLTGERLISFARNTISRTFAKTLFTGGAKHYSLVLQLISFTKKAKPKYRKLRKHYSRARKNTIKKTRKIIREIRTTFFKLSDWSDLRFWISNQFSHPTPLFIAFLNLHNFNLFTKMPLINGEGGLGVKWPFYPLAI